MAAPADGPRVLAQLHGGLGNQLFQAAAGLALADRLGGRLWFDISRFRDRGLRAYALADLPVGADIWPSARPGLGEKLRARFDKILGGKGIRRPPGWRGAVHAEPHYHYDPGFERLAGEVMLAGFFQSPRYFAGREALIRARLDPAGAMGADARQAAERLGGEDSIAVHIRRGDYDRDPRAAAVHGVLDDAYYDRAMALVRERAGGACRVFVFSDDATFAAGRAARWGGEAMAGQGALEDLWLMSRCRHHIIANSTFSWWSAWLDARPGGTVVAPAQWFAPSMLAQTRIDDLFPPGWARL